MPLTPPRGQSAAQRGPASPREQVPRERSHLHVVGRAAVRHAGESRGGPERAHVALGFCLSVRGTRLAWAALAAAALRRGSAVRGGPFT